MKLLIIFCFFLLPVLCSGFIVPDYFYKLMINKVVTGIDKSNPGKKCLSDLKTFISDLRDHELWALQMLDANAKIHPGILHGNIYQFGNYDQCLGIRKKRSERIIEGQYCSASLTPNDDSLNLDLIKSIGLRVNEHDASPILEYFKFTIGVCAPKTCSSEDLQTIWDYIEKTYKLQLRVIFDKDLCTYAGKPIGTYGIDSLVFCFFAIIFVMVISSTFYDAHLRRNDQKADIFVTFSLYTNGLKLLSTNYKNTKFSCLYGIKVLSMIWIILTNICLINVFSANTNTVDILKLMDDFQITFFTGAMFAADTFFAISGILVAYVKMKYSDKSLFAFYGHRFFRLFPAMFAMFLCYIRIIKYLSDGPFWPGIVRRVTANCYSNRWATLFFFSNFIPLSDQCGTMWYLSIDTQLYVLTPIILYNIKKYPQKVFIGMAIACLISVVYSFTVTLTKNLGSTLLDGGINYHKAIYTSTLSRMPSWLIGICFGFLLHHYSNKKIQISKKVNLILLTISLCSMLGLVLYQLTFTALEYNPLRSAFYNALSRPLWSLSLCYIIFSCSTGQGGFINTLLSHSVFFVLGKLTYSMYLVNFAVLIVLAGYKKQAGYLGKLELFREFWGDFIVILFCSTIICLVFETPVLALMKHLTRRKSGIVTIAT